MSITPITDGITAHYQREARKARGETVEKEVSTVGQIASDAIDSRARAWHADGRFLDRSLAQLRTEIRKSMPALKVLERSGESMPVAKSRIVSADDRELSAAFGFVTEWS